MSAYTYQPIDSSQGEIRILTVPWDVKQTLGRAHVGPLTGTLTNILLPVSTLSRAQRLLRVSKLPLFYALSYVWGEPTTKPQEIFIDGKSIPITQNLYDGLRSLQKNAYGLVRVWADALCICQEDMVERSAQIMLMREIYHSASEVAIWLGANSEGGRRAFKFINDLTDAYETIEDPVETEDDKVEENIFNFLKPLGTLARGSFRIAQAFDQVPDIASPAGLDSKAEILIDPDGDYSLHRIESGNPEWRPSARRLAKVIDEGNFSEVAGLISRIFTQNDWFSRMWVVQEVGVADSIHFQLGGMSMGWNNVFDTISYLHYTRGIPIEGIRRVTALERIRGGWSDRKRHPLQDLMRECRYRKATNPRDKIYSLLGMMGDPMNDFLQPDYSLSVGNVYSNVTRHFLSQSESLDPICGWQTLGRNKDSTWELPSWTPDYTLDQENAPAPLVPVDRRPSIYAASGYDHRSKFQLSAHSTHPEWKQLHIHGIYIDSAARLSNPGPEKETFGTKATRWLSTLTSAQEFLKGLTEDVQSSLVDLCSIVSEYSNYHYSTDRSILQFESPEEVLSIEENQILDAFIHTLLLGRISSRERLENDDLEEIIGMGPLIAFSESKETEQVDKVCQAFEAGSKGRRLLITEKGYIGSVPQTAEEGDILCVLFGCSVPVILRRHQDENSCEFVGECYLHSFLDAEAIALQVKGVLKEQEFILV